MSVTRQVAQAVSALEAELDDLRRREEEHLELLVRARRILGSMGEPANRHPVNVNAYRTGLELFRELCDREELRP